MENNFILKHYGRLYNPSNWGYYPNYLTNRIYYICGGTAYYKGFMRLKPGYMYIFKSDSSFQVTQDDNDPIDHIYFDFISSVRIIDREYIEVDPARFPVLKTIIGALTLNDDINSFPTDVAESYFNIISYELREYLTDNKAYSGLISQALHYIHENSPADLTVTGISDALNINVNHLIRTFKKETGITPLKYIGLLKSEYAINYTRRGYTFDDIAAMLGYSSVSALSVAFKNTTHKNLSEFR
ncbi:MAG: AraC family transcriptional regulator [Lachnospiraceae bacterium]|nr:AraC family transcriptional regulator [Lachnospiraceae bacterium]